MSPTTLSHTPSTPPVDPKRRRPFGRWALLMALGCAAACSDDGRSDEPPAGPLVEVTEEREPCDDRNPLRNPYFGDLHVHTANSFDAYINGTRPGPADAYRFAAGQPVALPPLDEQGQGTQTIALRRPLDFVAVTDHAEYLAEVAECTTPGAEGFDTSRCETYRQGGQTAITSWGVPLTNLTPQRLRDLCGDDGARCAQQAGTVWQRVIDAAEEAYDRTSACTMTTFIGFEWTGNTVGRNLHRNVIFRNHIVPQQPASYFEAPTAPRLWEALDQTCVQPGQGCDVLAIPHNSNLSNGGIFAPVYDEELSLEQESQLALLRARMEPLVEIFQHKGNSECNNGLDSLLGAPDELCDEEQLRPAPFDDRGDELGFFGIQASGCVSRYDYVRSTLLEGLAETDRLGANPYKLGIIASTDTHNASPGFVDEAAYQGHTGLQEIPAEKQLERQILPFGLVTNPGGLAGVWAVENSRDAIFEALKRRETWGTSGPRIVVRFFAGQNLDEGLCDDPQMISRADVSGVPMGGTLTPAPGRSPRFLLSALRDPDQNATGLGRLEIIKGWLTQDGELRQKVFVVAGSADNGAGVNTDTCEPTGTSGADSLCTTWSDPEYDAGQRAFYYARVVENPSCRWSQRLCQSLPEAQRPAGCQDPGIPTTIHEMAWTSPIWLEP